MTHTINIEGINLHAYHGCLDEEERIGGHYVVDVYMTTDFTKAAKDDDLNKTVDYVTVYNICKTEMAIRSKLIEPVCQRIYEHIRKEFSNIKTLHVRVTKLTPPMNGDVDKVSVEIKD